MPAEAAAEVACLWQLASELSPKCWCQQGTTCALAEEALQSLLSPEPVENHARIVGVLLTMYRSCEDGEQHSLNYEGNSLYERAQAAKQCTVHDSSSLKRDAIVIYA